MSKVTHPTTELTLAAQDLESELEAFEKFAEGLGGQSLNSQKSIERVAKLLQTVPEVDERLSVNVQRLVTAVGNARQRQAAHAEIIQRRATEIQQRVEKLQTLMEGYAGLGRSAADINGVVQAAAVARSDGSADADAQLEHALEQMGAWARQADELIQRAKDEDFLDVARLADSLRQQLLAARNKAQLLRRPAQSEGRPN